MKTVRILSVLLLVVIPACGGSDPIVVPEETTIELLEAGAEPRIPLRYELGIGEPEKVEIVLAMSMTMDLEGEGSQNQQIPAMRMAFVLEAVGRTPDGDYECTMNFTDAGLADPGSADPGVAAAMEQAMGMIEGIRARAVIDDRGRPKSLKMELPPNAPPQLSQMMGSLEQQLDSMAAPLPEEPVGVGARWVVRMGVENQGMTIAQEAEYHLVEMREKGAILEVKITQDAPVQELKTPGMPANVKYTIEKLHSTGSGRLDLDLRRLAPQSALTLEMHMEGTISMGDEEKSTTTDMKMEIEIGSAEDD